MPISILNNWFPISSEFTLGADHVESVRRVSGSCPVLDSVQGVEVILPLIVVRQAELHLCAVTANRQKDAFCSLAIRFFGMLGTQIPGLLSLLMWPVLRT